MSLPGVPGCRNARGRHQRAGGRCKTAGGSSGPLPGYGSREGRRSNLESGCEDSEDGNRSSKDNRRTKETGIGGSR